MRIRSLSVSLLAAAVLVPVSSMPATAATSVETLRASSPSGSPWKNSLTRRRTFIGPTTAVAAAPRITTPPVAPAPSAAQAYQDRVLALTNAERTSRGLRALAPNTCADGYADRWAGSLAQSGSLAHQAMSPILTACAARGVGENVAYGNVTPAELVALWMGSAGHRANILNAAYTHLGVGAVTTGAGRTYGVQVFVTR